MMSNKSAIHSACLQQLEAVHAQLDTLVEKTQAMLDAGETDVGYYRTSGVVIEIGRFSVDFQIANELRQFIEEIE